MSVLVLHQEELLQVHENRVTVENELSSATVSDSLGTTDRCFCCPPTVVTVSGSARTVCRIVEEDPLTMEKKVHNYLYHFLKSDLSLKFFSVLY